MTRSTKTSACCFAQRALMAMLCAPMTLVSAVNAGTELDHRGADPGKKGLGLVLLVSLQRG